jgi:DNA-binding CsgD family transcriptional regulator
MTAAGDEIFGRDRELKALGQFVDSVGGGPSAMLLEGEAGIGKTTLLRAALDVVTRQAARIMECRPAEAERDLPFGALGDLLEEVIDEALPLLFEPQRRALEVVLLRIPPDAAVPDRRAVSLAVLGVLRVLSDKGPVVILIDDLQWLDSASARVLEYALRRLDSEPVGVLATCRSQLAQSLPLSLDALLPEGRYQQLAIAPLSLEDVDRLLRARLDQPFLRPTLAKIHRTAGGNPFFALELGRALLKRGVPLSAGEPLPVPDNLRALIEARLAGLPVSVREALLAVAAISRPTVEQVEAVVQPSRRVTEDLIAAADARVIELDDREVRFTHPLLASAVYAEAPLADKMRLHARLAAALEDPVERARHLALANHAPDAGVSRALDDSARHARARGAPEAAAMLAEHARRLTPADHPEDLARRGIEAADYHLQAGDTARARVVLEEVVGSPTSPAKLQRALHLLAKVVFREQSYAAAVNLLERALAASNEDPPLEVAIRCDLALSLEQGGELARAVDHVRAALRIAEDLGEPVLLARALVGLAVAEFLLGLGVQAEVMQRAMTLMDSVESVRHQELASVLDPTMVWAVLLKWSDDFEPARTRLEDLYRQALERNEESLLPPVLLQLGELECWYGNWDLAARYAEEGRRFAVQSGQVSMEVAPLYVQALVEAHRGHVAPARASVARALDIIAHTGDHRARIRCLGVLGFVELSLGNPSGAHEHLGPATDMAKAAGYGEPGVFRLVPNEIEALVALGELEGAELLTQDLEERGRTLDRPWALATGARCRALLATARGDLLAAVAALDEALMHHARLLQPFEFARTLLVQGIVQRRRRQKRLAREPLERAAEIFERLGAPLWSERAADELARIGGRAPAPASLTATEQRVADLVAAGATNREVSESLFMSAKTVERHLTHVYEKLGVRSRRELARLMSPDRSSLERS